MDVVALVGLLVLGIVVGTPLAARTGVPQPVLLVLYGLGLALVPGVPAPDVPPEVILPLVLPPLLFAATLRGSVRELRGDARAILVLAVGLTLLSAGAVAVVGHLLGLPWAVALALGAIVAPPDPVAATAVAQRLRLPPRLVTVLEGEGQFNDATALVLYQLAVTAVVAGGVSAGDAGWSLLLAVAGGTLVGLALGWVARWALVHLDDAPVETTVTIALPYGAYLLAEHLGGSGVLAVLAAGMFLRTAGAGAATSGGWLLGRAVWGYVDFAVSGLLFGFLGLELASALRSTGSDAGSLALAAAVVAVLLLVRAAVVFATSAAEGRRARRAGSAAPAGWREAAVASWAGMRGVATVATALALPLTTEAGRAFPHRDDVLVAALVTVLVTLVLQGLTLAPLVRRLGVASSADERGDRRRLQRDVTEAALRRIAGCRDRVPQPVLEAVERQYRGRLEYRTTLTGLLDEPDGGAGTGADAERERVARALGRVLAEASDAEREAVLRARRRGEVSPAVADEVMRDVESRALRYR